MPPGTVVRTSNARHVQCLTQLSVLGLWLRSGAGAQARCLDGVAAQEMVRPPVLPGDREGQMPGLRTKAGPAFETLACPFTLQRPPTKGLLWTSRCPPLAVCLFLCFPRRL